ncbi:MAG: CAP domain-containing protein [Desulfuromonadales bacterium]|nr:MAG: CAP domain-containing protein [Desulfuromonadales bacterium]
MLAVVVLLLPLPLQAAAEGDLARAVRAELNAARANPRNYAEYLRAYRAHISGRYYIPPGSRTRFVTKEGAAAVDEAIRHLLRQKPLRPLAWSDALSRAAADLAVEQGKTGTTGHGEGKTGMKARIERHGRWERTIGENISYGPNEARGVVMQLIIDDGVPNRGHRTNIFDPTYGTVGITCGPHPVFETLCAIDFAGGFSD